MTHRLGAPVSCGIWKFPDQGSNILSALQVGAQPLDHQDGPSGCPRAAHGLWKKAVQGPVNPPLAGLVQSSGPLGAFFSETHEISGTAFYKEVKPSWGWPGLFTIRGKEGVYTIDDNII